jgi:hypothetical protein
MPELSNRLRFRARSLEISEFTLTIGTPTLKQKPQRMMSLD